MWTYGHNIREFRYKPKAKSETTLHEESDEAILPITAMGQHNPMRGKGLYFNKSL